MAFGVGFVSFAAQIDPLAASITEVQADAKAVVIGTMPANDRMLDLTAGPRQSRTRRILIASGLLLIAACPAVAVWGVSGL